VDLRKKDNPRLWTETGLWHWPAVENVRDILKELDRALENNLLGSLSDLVASEVYDDVLAEAEGLLKGNNLHCAAILTRLGMDDALKRLARRHGMPDVETAMAGAVNDWLLNNQVYTKQTHRLVQTCLDPGNAFAHNLPDKDQYKHQDVAKAIAEVRSFRGNHNL
jgi:hypothetical protein